MNIKNIRAFGAFALTAEGSRVGVHREGSAVVWLDEFKTVQRLERPVKFKAVRQLLDCFSYRNQEKLIVRVDEDASGGIRALYEDDQAELPFAMIGSDMVEKFNESDVGKLWGYPENCLQELPMRVMEVSRHLPGYFRKLNAALSERNSLYVKTLEGVLTIAGYQLEYPEIRQVFSKNFPVSIHVLKLSGEKAFRQVTTYLLARDSLLSESVSEHQLLNAALKTGSRVVYAGMPLKLQDKNGRLHLNGCHIKKEDFITLLNMLVVKAGAAEMAQLIQEVSAVGVQGMLFNRDGLRLEPGEALANSLLQAANSEKQSPPDEYGPFLRGVGIALSLRGSLKKAAGPAMIDLPGGPYKVKNMQALWYFPERLKFRGLETYESFCAGLVDLLEMDVASFEEKKLVVRKWLQVSLEENQAAVERSRQLLRRVVADTGAVYDDDRHVWSVEGLGGARYEIRRNCGVYRSNGNYVCIVNNSSGGVGYDYLASLLQALAHDQHMGNQIQTLK
jgi:hypothetical protein